MSDVLPTQWLTVPTVQLETSSNAVAPTDPDTNTVVQGEEGRPEPISEPDVEAVTSDYVVKDRWRNAGFDSIASLVETYYWAMREGRLDRYSECLCDQERQLFVKKEAEKERSEFMAALRNVAGYNIKSVVKTNGQSVVIIQHSLTGGKRLYEFLAVLKAKGQFKIEGAKGYLYYWHHGPVPIALVVGYHRQENP